MVVIGPVAYITFCCKRPLRAQGPKCCIFCKKLVTCFWCRRRFGCIDDAEQQEHDDISISALYDRSHEPPDYDEALTMPRVEDTIPGTPPPMYRDYFKVKEEPDDWCYSNPVFEFEMETISRMNSNDSNSTFHMGPIDIGDNSVTSRQEDGVSNLTDVEVVSIISSMSTVRIPRQLRRNASRQASTSSNSIQHTIEDKHRTYKTWRRSRVPIRSASTRSRTSRYSITEQLPTYTQAIFLMERAKRSSQSATEITS